ncbi:lipid IV(A) 3-deoxy-D-manno-octulosonic acid transferase [Methyloversatilis thermotolerans]|uniref:lipid IV(A) 3-deoxy-D-manno-octulosonic acid transferase n=1 Tax=Methyloversatilis thermotolerans TaxID=1346290 RepID=UPI00037392C5|nr:lipid IV(A) 3-deoxy-D-manno-octulosonic acid transferase [Methyloversatilis thermotolerans]
MSRTLYSLLWLCLLPLAVLRLLWRSRREPAYRLHMAERLGMSARAIGSPVIWIHAVSVGETRAAQPLIEALQRQRPDAVILLSQTTAAGRGVAETLFDGRVMLAWLPWDLPWAQRAFLRRWQPELGIVLETEIWPNLLHEAARAGIPVVLANARLSARSARGYARLGGFIRHAVSTFAQVIAQTDADAVRLRALGARQVTVAGNLKFDMAPPASQTRQGSDWRASLARRAVVLLASTRDGEETMLLDALLPVLPAEVLIALVPRHPDRFDEVAALVRARGISMCRRGAGEMPAAGTRLWLGDSMGEMSAWYALADIALIGGSWLPLGGQNLIEACAVGCPVIVGPHTFNFQQVTADAVAAGAALRARDTAEAAAQAVRLLGDAQRRAAMGEAGRTFSAAHRGATARTMAAIEPLLRRSSEGAISAPGPRPRS